MPKILGSDGAPLDLGTALRVLDAVIPPTLPEPRRHQLAVALMLLVAEIQSEILAAARAEDAAAFDAEGLKMAAALNTWVMEARRRNRVEAASARALHDALAMLRSTLAPADSHPASRRGRRPKGDVLPIGLLLSFYAVASGRDPGPDEATLAFVRSVVEAAAMSFEVAALGSSRPLSGKLGGRRWLPPNDQGFNKRFGEFEAAMDRPRVLRFIERAGEIQAGN